jgi:hypothetical protein
MPILEPDFFNLLGIKKPPLKKENSLSPITDIISVVRNKIEVLGGIYIKFDGFEIYFDIPQNSDANNNEFLRRQRDALASYKITLKTRIVR